MGRIQSDPAYCLFTCAQTWKTFLFAHTWNRRQIQISPSPFTQQLLPYAVVREGNLRQCIKILDYAKSTFTVAVPHPMDVSLTLGGVSAAFNNQMSISSFSKFSFHDIIFFDSTLSRFPLLFWSSFFRTPTAFFLPCFVSSAFTDTLSHQIYS